MRTRRPYHGYTLIELIVSVAIFSIVMVFAASAYLALIAATRHARATSTIITNISTAVDTMARTIRTGSKYACGAGGDCLPPGGGTSFSFTNNQGQKVTYLLVNGVISQCVNIACTSSSASALTDPSITISSLAFYVRGTKPASQGDAVEPNVIITVKGSSAVLQGAPVTFSIETSATERLIDTGT